MGEGFLGFPNGFRILGTDVRLKKSVAARITNSSGLVTEYRMPDGVGGDFTHILESEYINTTGSYPNDLTQLHNYVLSAYYGYLLSTNYVNRVGGKKYGMVGSLYTKGIYPDIGDDPSNNVIGHNIGSDSSKYREVHATRFYGDLTGHATTAGYLSPGKQLTITLKSSDLPGNCRGSIEEFTMRDNTEITVDAPYLPIGDEGKTTVISGKVAFNNRVTLNNEVGINGPTSIHDKLVVLKTSDFGGDAIFRNNATIKGTTIVNKVLPENRNVSLGDSGSAFSSIYANVINANQIKVSPTTDSSGNTVPAVLDGNATSASQLINPRKIAVHVNPSYDAAGWKMFDGSGDICIETRAEGYLPLSGGGTISGSLAVTGSTALNGSATIQGGVTVNNGVTVSSGNLITNDIHVGEPNHLYTNSIAPCQSNGDIGRYVSFFGKNTVDGYQNITAYIDDLATNSIVASSVLDGVDNDTEHHQSEVTIYASKVKFYQVGAAPSYTNKANQIAVYSAKNGLLTDLECGDVDCTHVDTSSLSTSQWISCSSLTVNGNAKITGELKHGSDIRLKKNISPINRSLSVGIVSKTIPTTYDLMSTGDKNIRGVIAQQVKEASLELGYENTIYQTTDDKDGSKTMEISYMGYIPDLINTCQYLIAKVDKLEVLVGVKKELEFPELQHEAIFDESYYREHAEEIANM